MGCVRQEILNVSEKAVPSTNVKGTLIGTIQRSVCEGQMTFRKTSSGDTIYIGLGGKIPKSNNYNIILTDSIAGFTEEAIIHGDITALGSVAGSILSTYVSGSVKG